MQFEDCSLNKLHDFSCTVFRLPYGLGIELHSCCVQSYSLKFSYDEITAKTLVHYRQWASKQNLKLFANYSYYIYFSPIARIAVAYSQNE